MRRYFLFLFFALLWQTLAAQEIVISGNLPDHNIQWEEHPKLTQANEQEKGESAFFVLHHVRYELKINPINDNALMYFTTHNIIHINDDKGLEGFNTIELPSSKSNKYVQVKARAIKPDGKIIELKEEAFKEQKDDEGRVYRMFAFEGLEKNSDIEYYYTLELPFQLTNRDVLQFSIPSRKALFELYSPKYTVFECKGYNGFRVNCFDTLDEYNLCTGESQNIAAIEEEKYSYRSNYLQRVEFNLAYNKQYSSGERLNTWDKIGDRIGKNLYPTKGELAQITSFMQKQKEFKSAHFTKDKIVWIENFIKENFKIVEDLDDKYADNFAYVLKNKQSNEFGFNKLMLAAFLSADIDARPVLTCNKSAFPFDTKMVSSLYIQDMLLYFPETKDFIMPTAVVYRLPMIPIVYENTEGLMISLDKNEEFETEFVKTTGFSGNESAHNVEAEVSLNLSELKSEVKYKQLLKGHGAIPFKPYFVYGTKEQQDEVFKNLMSFGNEKEDVYANQKVENQALMDAVDNKPMILSADITTNTLLEKAGTQYLFKVGKLIGRQAEMYQEKARQTDINIDYMHHLVRKLSIKIPDGYEARNLDKIKMNVVASGDHPAIGFTSDYKIEGTQIVIDVDEWYLVEKLPKSDIEIFRKVINAAADFEKIMIAFEKKQ